MRRISIWNFLTVLMAVASGLCAHSARAETNMGLYGFEGSLGAWRGGSVVKAPAHSGERAMKWMVADQPVFDSHRFVADWSEFEELRFWAYSEEASGFRIPIVFVCKGGYWIAEWRVNWTGWKEHRVKLSDAKPMRKKIDWKDISRIGFRARGYGQKAIPKTMALVFDDFSLCSAKDLGVASMEDWMRQGPKKRLARLKKTGNPYFASVLEGLEGVKATPEIKKDFDSCWKFRTLAEKAQTAAWAAGSDDSPRKGDKTLVAYASAHIDFILSSHKDGSWFYSRKWTKGGDPNTDRFTLGPTMDAIWYLRQLPGTEAAWKGWEKPLREAVEFQRRHWGKPPDESGFRKAWGAFGYVYPNQDVYHLMEMELAHQWWGEAVYREEVERTIAGLQAQLLPDGGLRYIGPETECPVYHRLNLVWLARYLNLTGDERVRKLIVDTVGYYPLTMSNEGYPESYTDCWWKHYWGTGQAAGPEIVAGLTGDARHKWLANRCLENGGVGKGFWAIATGMFYRDDIQEKALADNWLVLDRNIDGPRGRFGSFYFAGVVGGGARDTFAGCMISDPKRSGAMYGALLAANVQIVENRKTSWRLSRLHVSGPDDKTAVYVGSDVAALGARYTVRRAYFNTKFKPEVAPTAWRATQVWLFTPKGLVGLVEVEATERQEALAVRGELRFGPRLAVEKVGDGEYRCGGLTARILGSNYPEIEVVRNAPTHASKRTGQSSVNPTTAGDSVVVEAGERLWYAASVGPDGFAPSGFERVVENGKWGVRVTIDGRDYVVLFDPVGEGISVR